MHNPPPVFASPNNSSVRLAKRTAELRIQSSSESINQEETEDRLKRMRLSQTTRRSNESDVQRSQRQAKDRSRHSLCRSNELDIQRSQRLEQMRNRDAVRRSMQSPEEKEKRREELRRRMARLRDYRRKTGMPALYKQAMDHSATTYDRLGSFDVACIHDGALHFPEERTGGQHHRDSFNDCCRHGKIKKATQDFPGGVPMNEDFPAELMLMFMKGHPYTKEYRFHERIRNLNSCFAMASFCADNQTSSRGLCAFKIKGQVYHRLSRAVHPTQDDQGNYIERPEYGPLYFMDSDEAVEHRMIHPANLTQNNQRQALNRDVVEFLDGLLRTINPFAQAYELMRDVEEEVNRQAEEANIPRPAVNLLFTMEKNADVRRYNVPVVNEVSAVMILNADGSIPDNRIVVQPRTVPLQQPNISHRPTEWLHDHPITLQQHGYSKKELITLSNMDPRIEPMVYPLFYPTGTFGWQDGMNFENRNGIRKRLSRQMFVRYRMAVRRQTDAVATFTASGNVSEQVPFNPLHFGEKLFQQYCVDMAVRIERDRIQWIKDNQKKLKADKYALVDKFLAQRAEEEAAVVMKKIIMPSDFVGSPRWYKEYYEDAMALVRRYGRPDFFHTFTCNPNWPEIKEAIRYALPDGTVIQQQANMRPDIVARVFHLKSDAFIRDIFKNQVFGKCAAYVATIETQKRGLLHMHLLQINDRGDKILTPEQVDDFITAEIPDREEDPELYNIVNTVSMVHDPCGDLNPNAPCMDPKTKRCRWNFPKPFQNETTLREDEPAQYRRREVDYGDHWIIRKDKHGDPVNIDNRRIAPYNGYCVKKNNAHICSEYVGASNASVKYLYKYIFKGHDIAQIKVVNDDKNIVYDETEKFIEGRYIASHEACWRINEFPLQERSHKVERLDVHLPGQERNENDMPADLADIGQKGTTLEAWFKLNQRLKQKETQQAELRRIQDRGFRPLTTAELTLLTEEIIYHYYWQIPEHYTWHSTISEWKPQGRRTLKIGRMYNASPAQPDRYHLRLLLLHVKGATCFEDLRHFNGELYPSYKAACLARGLTYDDKQWHDGLREHCTFMMPRAMRTFFANILMYGEPSDPKRLWEEFKDALAEDFIRAARRNGTAIEEAIKKAYQIIANTLNSDAPESRKFDYWVVNYNFEPVNVFEVEQDLQNEVTRDIAEERGNEMFEQLNREQRAAAQAILEAADKEPDVTKCFFIDGPGGTGKSFLFRTLYFLLLAKGRKVINMATTGIAATLLPEGKTAHKTFALDVPLRSDSESRIKSQTVKAYELADTDVFFLDEAPMLPRYGMENINAKLREIQNNQDVPFGGATVVFGGDFRQCLPVQARANQSEIRDLSIKNSRYLWAHFSKFKLTQNMRADAEEMDFKEWLLKIGDDKEPTDIFGRVAIPNEMLSTGDLVEEIFGHCLAANNYKEMVKRAILCPFNRDAAKHNARVIDRLPGELKSYTSFDSVKDAIGDSLHLAPEYLNKLVSPDLPPHELKLKPNTVVMLLRNMVLREGLCNGTRILVTRLENNVIHGRIVTDGVHYDRQVSLHRITLDTSKGLGFTLSRHQFPIKPAFAMTIHKSQGQTFESVGVDLTSEVFGHGQLYVALSRVRRASALKVLLDPANGNRTKNVVDRQILEEEE